MITLILYNIIKAYFIISSEIFKIVLDKWTFWAHYIKFKKVVPIVNYLKHNMLNNWGRMLAITNNTFHLIFITKHNRNHNLMLNILPVFLLYLIFFLNQIKIIKILINFLFVSKFLRKIKLINIILIKVALNISCTLLIVFSSMPIVLSLQFENN